MQEVVNKFLDSFPILIIIVFLMCCVSIYFGAVVTVPTFLSILFWASVFDFIFTYIDMKILK